jgi:hypothetical protein
MTQDQKLDNLEMILKKFIREQNTHNQRVNLFCANQEALNTQIAEDVNEVKRGLYGDPKNEVVGVITRQNLYAQELKKVKLRLNRAFWWGGGVIAGLNVAIFFIKEWFTHK